MGSATGLRPAPLLAGVVAAGVLVATVMTGPDAGADVRTGQITVAYACLLADGTQALQVSLTQDYPTADTAGAPLQPGPLTLRTAVPRGLLPAGAASVSGTVALQVSVAESDGASQSAAPKAVQSSAGQSTLTLRTSARARAAGAAQPGSTAEWSGLTVAPVRLGTADPELTATGRVAALTAGPDGSTTTVTPAALTLSLVAGGSTVQLACTPSAAPGTLGSVYASSAPRPESSASAGADPSAAVRRRALSAAQVPSCLSTPSGSLNPSDLIAPPPGAIYYPPLGQPPADTGVECAYAIGYANVGKLGEASLVNNPADDPGLATLAVLRDVYSFTVSPPFFEAEEIGSLTLPPADTTFLTYGFMPTTAKMQLIPHGPLTVVNTGAGPYYQEASVTTISGEQTLRLYDVEVDGTPLNVGPDCRTVTPLQLKLVGTSHQGLPGDDPTRDYQIATGGPISQDQLTIPYFTGCGSGGQDLDPLFDAAVSGTGNSLNLVQGPICTTFQGTVCNTFTMPVLPSRAPKTPGQ